MQSRLMPTDSVSPGPSLSWFSSALILVCGVVLPTVTVLVEALRHICADIFFDPFPTVGHVIAVAVVPLANGFSLWTLKRREGTHIEAVIFAQAFAVAIAGVYALIFAPIVPIAVVGIFFWGLGLLPLSPVLSLVAGLRALIALRALRRALALPVHRVVLGGLAAGIGVLLALNVP